MFLSKDSALARHINLGYTPLMRLIDRKWTDLSLGWQHVQSLQARLETDHKRALQVGHEQKYRRELSDWQKKRRILLATAILAPLSLAGLCLATYYFQEVACVLAWWTMTVVVIFITLGVAGWNLIRESVTGQPEKKRGNVEIDLADLWWKSLAPEPPAVTKRSNKSINFPSQLAEQIPAPWLMVKGLIPAAPGMTDADVLLVGPAGIWLFTLCDREGRIGKRDGTWKQKVKREPEKELVPAPDSHWTQQKEKIVQAVQSQVPTLAWCVELLQGGVVFTHPKAILHKSEISDHMAPYGPGKAWIERLQRAVADERLSLEVQLDLLDTFIRLFREGTEEKFQYQSSRDEAERLYEAADAELKELVGKLMK